MVAAARGPCPLAAVEWAAWARAASEAKVAAWTEFRER